MLTQMEPDYVTQHPPVYHPLRIHYDSVVWMNENWVTEVISKLPKSTLATYPLDHPTSTSH
jgi:hypothetical protein